MPDASQEILARITATADGLWRYEIVEEIKVEPRPKRKRHRDPLEQLHLFDHTAVPPQGE